MVLHPKALLVIHILYHQILYELPNSLFKLPASIVLVQDLLSNWSEDVLPVSNLILIVSALHK